MSGYFKSRSTIGGGGYFNQKKYLNILSKNDIGTMKK